MDERANAEERGTESGLEAVGKRLAQQRIDCGLTQIQLANQLHIGPEQLAALEIGATDQLPEPVFIRAMVRRISAHLGMDADAMVADLRMSTQPLGAAKGAMPTRRQNDPPAQQRSRGPVLVLGVAIAVAGVAAVVRNIPLEIFNPGSQQPASAPSGSASSDSTAAQAPPAIPVQEDTSVVLEIEKQPVRVIVSSREPSWIALRRDGTVEYRGLLQDERLIENPENVEIYTERPDLVIVKYPTTEPAPLGDIEDVGWIRLNPQP